MNQAVLTALVWMTQLSLQDVMQQLPHHPAWKSAAAEVEHATAMRLSADGAFDLQSALGGAIAPAGKWRKGSATATLEQAFPVVGRPTVEVGYRYGHDFPVWDGSRSTSSAGEMRAQASMELANGLWIDEGRASQQKSDWGIKQAKAGLAEVHLQLAEQSTKAYFAWVAAGHLVKVEEKLLQAAEARQSALERQAEKGAIAAILLAENQRMVLSRRADLVAANQDWINAAHQLSYYFRDEKGQMLLPQPESLPALDGGEAVVLTLSEAESLVRSRPEMRIYDAWIEQVQIERRLADNQLLPSLTTSLSISQDLGAEIPVGPQNTSNTTEMYVGIRMKMPVQRRQAEGKSKQARAKDKILQQKKQQAIERLLVSVRNAHQSVWAAEERAKLALAAREAAEQIEGAERRRFAEGQSDLLAVNLREQATASEARKWVTARAKLQEARTLYRLAAGIVHQS